MLAHRLARHGLAVSGGALAAFFLKNVASASVPASVVSSTIKAATLFATGEAAGGAISVNVVALTEGVLKMMLLSKLRIAVATFVVIIMFGCGLLALSPSIGPAAKAEAQAPNAQKIDSDKPQKSPTSNDEKPADNKPEKPKPDKEILQGTWVIISEEMGGKAAAKDDLRPQWWHFEDDKLTMYGIDLRSSKPEKSEYTYALTEEKKTKTLALTGGRRLEGPRTKAPEDMKALYKVEGATLTIAIGKKELPSEFKTKDGDGVVVVVFKREGRTPEKEPAAKPDEKRDR